MTDIRLVVGIFAALLIAAIGAIAVFAARSTRGDVSVVKTVEMYFTGAALVATAIATFVFSLLQWST